MPTSNEIVQNRSLSGIELRKIIVEDIDMVLAKDGMFTEYVGYGRIGYEVIVKLHLDNPAYPEHTAMGRSKKKPDIQSIEPLPLSKPSDESVVVGLKRTRTIDNPNKERVRRGMPITIDARDPNDGRLKEKQITYSLGEAGLDPKESESVKDEDVTDKTKAEWGL